MENNKQTAVEWLVDQIKNDQNQKALSAKEWLGVIKQAKEMEAEQMDWNNKHHQTEISDEELEQEVLNFLYGFEYEVFPHSASYKFDYEACAKALTQRFKEILKNKQ